MEDGGQFVLLRLAVGGNMGEIRDSVVENGSAGKEFQFAAEVGAGVQKTADIVSNRFPQGAEIDCPGRRNRLPDALRVVKQPVKQWCLKPRDGTWFTHY